MHFPHTTPIPLSDLSEAQGYYELGMIEECKNVLATIEQDQKTHPDYLELTILLLLWENSWDKALEASRAFTLLHPSLAFGYVHIAFAQHLLGETEEALQTLIEGPTFLKTEPVYHYNKACYLASLFRLQEAELSLREAVKKDPRLFTWAEQDPDLDNLRNYRQRTYGANSTSEVY